MSFERQLPDIMQPDADAIQLAVEALRRGDLVVMPTETVYGLAADARNVQALKKLYQAKGRPEQHPVIVHIAGLDEMGKWARDIPAAAWALGKAFWPGPLTLILKRLSDVPDEVTGGQDTIGLRVPGHPVALELLEAFQGGIAAPSANRFGRISPTKAEDVRQELGEAVSVILEGGGCDVGIESSIVDLTGDRPRILRPGLISAEQMEEVLKMPVEHAGNPTVRAPGTLPGHYAPATPVALLSEDDLRPAIAALSATGHRKLVILVRDAFINTPRHEEVIRVLQTPDDPEAYAQELYGNLRQLDTIGADVILVEDVPESEPWRAVRDRLQRAAHGFSATMTHLLTNPPASGEPAEEQDAEGEQDAGERFFKSLEGENSHEE